MAREPSYVSHISRTRSQSMTHQASKDRTKHPQKSITNSPYAWIHRRWLAENPMRWWEHSSPPGRQTVELSFAAESCSSLKNNNKLHSSSWRTYSIIHSSCANSNTPVETSAPPIWTEGYVVSRGVSDNPSNQLRSVILHRCANVLKCSNSNHHILALCSLIHLRIAERELSKKSLNILFTPHD